MKHLAISELEQKPTIVNDCHRDLGMTIRFEQNEEVHRLLKNRFDNMCRLSTLRYPLKDNDEQMYVEEPRRRKIFTCFAEANESGFFYQQPDDNKGWFRTGPLYLPIPEDSNDLYLSDPKNCVLFTGYYFPCMKTQKNSLYNFISIYYIKGETLIEWMKKENIQPLKEPSFITFESWTKDFLQVREYVKPLKKKETKTFAWQG